MGFYNLEKLREEALKATNGFRPLHELEIDGEKQDDDEDPDYTGDDDGDPDTPENGVEEPEADYTAPEGDDTDETGDGGQDGDGDVPQGDDAAGDANAGESAEGTANDGEPAGGADEPDSGDPNAAVDAEETPDEADYTIPDDAGPEAQSADAEDQGAAGDVEADYTDTGDTGGDNVDYTADDGEGETTDTATGGGDTSAPDAGTGSDTGADTDYTQDDGGDAGEGDTSGGEENTGDAEDGSGGSAINDELKSAEDQLMADLSDEQKQIQSDELRKNFLDLYNTVLDVIDKVNNIHKEESTLQVFEFISSQLLILKDIINTNITRSFDTKTYIENNIDYQHCLAILNSVRLMIDETNKKSKKEKEE